MRLVRGCNSDAGPLRRLMGKKLAGRGGARPARLFKRGCGDGWVLAGVRQLHATCKRSACAKLDAQGEYGIKKDLRSVGKTFVRAGLVNLSSTLSHPTSSSAAKPSLDMCLRFPTPQRCARRLFQRFPVFQARAQRFFSVSSTLFEVCAARFSNALGYSSGFIDFCGFR